MPEKQEPLDLAAMQSEIQKLRDEVSNAKSIRRDSRTDIQKGAEIVSRAREKNSGKYAWIVVPQCFAVIREKANKILEKRGKKPRTSQYTFRCDTKDEDKARALYSKATGAEASDGLKFTFTLQEAA